MGGHPNPTLPKTGVYSQNAYEAGHKPSNPGLRATAGPQVAGWSNGQGYQRGTTPNIKTASSFMRWLASLRCRTPARAQTHKPTNPGTQFTGLRRCRILVFRPQIRAHWGTPLSGKTTLISLLPHGRPPKPDFAENRSLLSKRL